MTDEKEEQIKIIVAAFNRGLKTSVARAKNLTRYVEYQKELQKNPDAPNPLPAECFGPTITDVAAIIVQEGIDGLLGKEIELQIEEKELKLKELESQKATLLVNLESLTKK